jgi:predicted DsbA family dithiol-disulfide isomerase
VGVRLSADAPLSVDVVSDVVCPWCYIGKRRLEHAASTAGLPLVVRWRPFQLDPTIPPEGKDRDAYLTAKFGSKERIRALHSNVVSVGASEGIAFAFDRIRVSPNTLDAHRLVRWAGESGQQSEIVEALFRAYFLEGRDIGDHRELVLVAESCGLDAATIAADLDSPRDRESVAAEIAEAQRIGVTGVPTFILDGRYGLVGAQPSAQLAAAMRDAAASAAVAAG